MSISILTGLVGLITATQAQLTLMNVGVSVGKENTPIGEEFLLNKPITLEQHVREHFKDKPILAEIARCESTFRQFGSNGRVLRGEVNRKDVGVMQINEMYHSEKALSSGYDIYTLDGNMAYAEYLYDKQGAKPWKASSPCWSKSEAFTSMELAMK